MNSSKIAATIPVTNTNRWYVVETVGGKCALGALEWLKAQLDASVHQHNTYMAYFANNIAQTHGGIADAITPLTPAVAALSLKRGSKSAGQIQELINAIQQSSGR